MTRLSWDRLLSEERLVDFVGLKDKTDKNNLFKGRHVFKRDTGKLIYSYDFRRLLSKTQVYFFSKSNDYVRTRLVHALEVAILGRSLGEAAALQLLKAGKLASDNDVNKIGDILFASCLCHDIGNPPFGHTGEKFIRQWFRETELGQKILALMPEEQRSDFLHFDGNAQGLRVLTKQVADFYQNVNPGLGDFADINLSIAVLGSFIKYPCFTSASQSNAKNIEQRKGGVMMTERQVFVRIVDTLQLFPIAANVWCRHPLVFLMEVADDICYNIIDLEDAYKIGSITEADMLEIFACILPSEMMSSYWEIKKQNNDTMLAVSYLRSKAINTLAQRAVELWLEKYEDIMTGNYHNNLMEDIVSEQLMAVIKKIAYEKIYAYHHRYHNRLQKVVFALLSHYGEILYQDNQSHLLWKKMVYNFNHRQTYVLQPQHMASCLLDYFGGMTDRCATRAYRQITVGCD